MNIVTARQLFARFKRTLTRGRRNESGYVLATSAMLMVPLMAVAGMATDVGGWYVQGSQQQKAADAAALAGVVWLPDLAKATLVAQTTARENGFDVNAADVDVTVSQVGAADLRVEIADNDVPVYFSRFFLDHMSLTRESVATYVLPVPLGSPKNYFGTGNMAPVPEGFWAAINGYCSPKEQGDPFAVGFQGNWPGTGIECPDTEVNAQYRGGGVAQYEYVIDVPASRPGPLVVDLFSPQKTDADPDRGVGEHATTSFTLRSPDATPFDDTDNPITTCAGIGETNPRTYAENVTDNDSTIFGVSGWSNFCTISTSAPAGRYVLGVSNIAGEPKSWGSNSYSIMASYSGTGAVCDGRTDSTCPGVYGKDWISILARTGSASADFYLAEIEPTHAGKQMEVTLFDPGEGGNTIRLIDPGGNPINFTYRTVDGLYSGGPTNSLNVSGCAGQPQVGPDRQSQCVFNERFVVLTVDLPVDYATRYTTDHWWKINYNFSTSVTDRSTWSVRIIGDPVHLAH